VDQRLAAYLELADVADDEFVRHAYRLILRRDPEPDALDRRLAKLADGTLSRATLLHELASSEEFTRLRALDDAVARAANAQKQNARPRSLEAPAASDERAVEIGWTLARYRGERRVLDVGYAFAEPGYLAALLRIAPTEPVGVDLAEREVPGMRTVVADVRHLPFEERSFDVVFCISTLEHVGRDNRIYGLPAEHDEEGMLAALQELRRVLARRGRLFVTVPCGKRADHGGFVVDEPDGWRALFERGGFSVHEDELYIRTEVGWRSIRGLPPGVRYGERHAEAVLCSELRL
jgi:O-antigen chain-terminating methyltransferase